MLSSSVINLNLRAIYRDHEDGECYLPHGKLMIKSFKLVNFRCFRSEEVEECKRINILVGRNSSGKTSFLEGIFLAMSNSPETVGRLRQWRGLDLGVFHGSQRFVSEAMWGDLFNDSYKDTAHLIAKGDNLHTRHLEMRVGSADAEQNQVVAMGMKPGGISFKYIVKGQPDFISEPFMVNNTMQMPAGPAAGSDVFFFAANHAYSSAESASRLSELSKDKRLDEFVRVFKGRYPDVESLSIELLAGIPLIYAQVSGVERRVPLSYISGGMNKFASMLLAFAISPGSIVLIDEIENGLYYKDMPEIWRLLLSFAKKYDCQLFASTHSGECLEAAGQIASEDPEEFSIIQANRGKLNQFQGDKFVWATDENIEIR